MTHPTISILMAAHDAQAYLPATLDSLLAQNYGDWELQVADDRSTDGTPDILRRYSQRDGRIRPQFLERNLGPAGARNAVLARATGTWVAILDADDLWRPGKLKTQVAALQNHPGAVWGYHGMRMVRGDQVVREPIGHEPRFGTLKQLITHCGVVHSSVMVSRAALGEVGGYNASLWGTEDWDLWIRLMQRYGEQAVVCLPQVLGDYRVHTSNISALAERSTANDRKLLRQILLRRGFFLAHPLLTLHAVDGQIERELDRLRKGQRHGRATVYALGSALAQPWKRWRWRRLADVCRGRMP